MGVPALFRWLSKKYPKIVTPVIEEDVGSTEYPFEYSALNPNGELDNLYLDMNAVVHPCSHPEDRPAPETESEMMLDVFKYTARVINMSKPRKVIMLAVDGVAPRAKMNQQRARRFRAAQDAKLLEQEKQEAIQQAEAQGKIIDEAIKGKRAWDSNSITPGTPFMDTLAKALRYWVAYKLATDEGWKNLNVIISDATVPGEGEHKIMEFVRSQRSDPSYDPNTSHCIYGLDADLIFLGLATHEPHFRVLREDVFADDKRKKNTHANFLEKAKDDDIVKTPQKKPFIWLHIELLRQYLEVELHVERVPFPFDFERAIDDWVFMCFFCGNDFLPHLPSLDVRDSSIDTLTRVWKNVLPGMGGFMTCDGVVDLDRVERLMQAIGRQEDNIFRKRREAELRQLREQDRRKREKIERSAVNKMTNLSKSTERAPVNPLDNIPLYDVHGNSVGASHMTNSELVANRNQITLDNKASADALKQKLLDKKNKGKSATELLLSAVTTPAAIDSKGSDNNIDAEDGQESVPIDVSELDKINEPAVGEKRKASDQSVADSTSLELSEDPVRMWEPGYSDRYYKSKFHASDDEVPTVRRNVVKSYIEGVCWVLLYYYQGCPSWGWFYPYHYAPFAKEMVDLKSLNIEFKQSDPFRPYEQLMSVLPAASHHTLPAPFKDLMMNDDSPIIDFYPENFAIDMNGKKQAWLGIPLLPFIDEKRLLETVASIYPKLTPEEVKRNTNLTEVVLTNRGSNLGKLIDSNESDSSIEVSGKLHTGISGKVSLKSNAAIPFPLESGDLPDIEENVVLVLNYSIPHSKYKNKSMLLNGVKLAASVLSGEDKELIRNGPRGNRYGNNFKYDGNTFDIKYIDNDHYGGYVYYSRHKPDAKQSGVSDRSYYQGNQRAYNTNYTNNSRSYGGGNNYSNRSYNGSNGYNSYGGNQRYNDQTHPQTNGGTGYGGGGYDGNSHDGNRYGRNDGQGYKHNGYNNNYQGGRRGGYGGGEGARGNYGGGYRRGSSNNYRR